MKKGLEFMKKKKGFKTILAVLACFVLVISAGILVFADDPTLTIGTEDYFVRSASVRLEDDQYGNGVRFKTVVKANVFENQLQNENVKTYTILIGSNALSGELTTATEGAQTVETTNIWQKVVYDDVEYYESTVYVYNIPSGNYGSDISVRSYVQYDSEDPIYTETKAASMAYVADAAVNSTSSSLDDTQKASLKATYLTYELKYTMGETEETVTIYYKDNLETYLPSGVLVWTNTAGTAYWNLQDTVTGPMTLKTTYAEALSGTGTSESPYIIDSQDDLEQLSVACTQGNTFKGKYFELAADLKTDKQISVTSVDADTTAGFRGTFDGNEKTIELDMKTDNQYGGLFGAIGANGLVKDLTVSGSVTSNYVGECRTGAIAGMVYGTVQNCTNCANVSGQQDVGGIAGRTWGGAVIDGCTNKGSVTATTSSFTGGIVSWMYNTSTVKNCVNEGNITGPSSIGGIVGRVDGSPNHTTNATKLLNNQNTGSIIGTAARVGGIAGVSTSKVLIEECQNLGSVKGVGTSTDGVGGIVGTIFDTDIVNCINGAENETTQPTITNTGVVTGGIVGYVNKAGVEITGCKNYAGITETGAYVGGIVGMSEYDTAIEDCANAGAIEGAYLIGGIVGFTEGTLVGCSNSGNIEATTYASASGKVPAGYSVGGIAGRIYNTSTTGAVTVEKSDYEIRQYTALNTYENVTGPYTASVLNCSNSGQVKGPGSSTQSSCRVGGIVGGTCGAQEFVGCYNSGEIIGYGLSGGILGYSDQSTSFAGSFNYCYQLGKTVRKSAQDATLSGDTVTYVIARYTTSTSGFNGAIVGGKCKREAITTYDANNKCYTE